MSHPVVTTAELAGQAGLTVTVRGWVFATRSHGAVRFLTLRDGYGLLQCVLAVRELPEELIQRFESLTQESSVEVDGVVRPERRAPGGFELQLADLRVVQIAAAYPISPKEHGVEFLMDNRHLWLRSRRQHAILLVRHTIIRAIRDFFDGRGFTLIDAPIFTPAACEGTTTLFETRYFDQSAYLTQSGQLYMEAAAMAFSKVYCFGPTFRAEKSKTRRHLIEFWMVEPEVAFARLDDVMQLAEEFICSIVQRVLETNPEQLKILERDPAPLEKVLGPFPRVSYNEAVERLHAQGIEFTWGDDFGSPQETALASEYDRPLFVHRFPAAIKAFYMEPDPEDERLALGADLLAPEGYGEIIGGGERMSSLARLEQRIDEHQLPRPAFEWYLDLRRYGSVPHGGFGLGVERTVAWICKLDHIRESIPFPRMLYRLRP